MIAPCMGGWRIAVSISNSDVMLFSNSDIILKGEGFKKGQKIAVIHSYFMYDPLWKKSRQTPVHILFGLRGWQRGRCEILE